HLGLSLLLLVLIGQRKYICLKINRLRKEIMHKPTVYNRDISLKSICLFAFSLLFFQALIAQNAQSVGIIRGVVRDKQTNESLIGAEIRVKNTEIGAYSDDKGNFMLENVPIGRVGISCSYIGYEPYAVEDIILTSTKEVFLEIGLNPGNIQSEDVVISATKNAFEAVNPLLVVSTRSFSVEETERIPAGINDPGRVALSFPGVKQGPDETENAIIVRGNSPMGILWRVEGIDIPNPNHFALIGSSVGGINVFSAQLLSRSDFSSGGMAAEYGNAISGAFDIHFRQGNLEKREHRFKLSLIGIDVATEGPIKKGRASYLVNYRYSTLGLLSKMGFHLVGERVTNTFQDLSFNMVFHPKNPRFKVSIFGIGGLSLEQYLPVKDSLKRDSSIFNHRQFQHKPSNMGTIGTTFTYLPNNKSYFKGVVALIGSDIIREQDTVNNLNTAYRYHTERFTDRRLSTSLTYNVRINEKIRIKTGVIAHQVLFNFSRDVKLLKSINNINNLERGGSVSGSGNTQILQQYTQMIWEPSPKLMVNVGYHFLRLNANKTQSFEPRVSLQFTPATNQKISFAYGIQGQALPLMTYFFKDSTGEYVNRNLKLLKTHHLVLAYHYYTQSRMKISVETYYQRLLNVPVIPNPDNHYWMLNDRQGYPTFQVTSDGKGTNYGLDVAVEKLFSKGYYLLATASVMQATFQPYNGKTYNTRWASRFSSSASGGKEFSLKKNRVLQIGGRILWSGNAPYTPYDPVLSAQSGTYVPLKDADNSKQLPNYFRWDTRIQYRYNAKKLAGSISLDIQNVINRANASGVGYDALTNTTFIQYRSGTFVPVISFQFDF
ncbi:MAG: carboxypeptidase-like regulatory domain-containing protein, partial [Bacteroidia bacterium]